MLVNLNHEKNTHEAPTGGNEVKEENKNFELKWILDVGEKCFLSHENSFLSKEMLLTKERKI